MIEPRTYQIRVRGHLDERRLRRFADVMIAHTADGETVITAAQLDQAALYALLSRLRDLGLELLALQTCPLPAGPDHERQRP